MSHRAIYTFYDSCTFVDRGEFTVEVSRKSFRLGISPLEEETSRIASAKEVISVRMTRMCICRSKSQIFRDSQGNLRSDESFYDRIICQVQEHGNMVGNTAFLKCFLEEIRNIMFDTHSGKYNSKLFIGIIPPEKPALRSVPQAGHAEVRFLRKSEASVHGSVWSVRRWRKYRCGYSFGVFTFGSGFSGSPLTSRFQV